jgi:hypothetical protein
VSEALDAAGTLATLAAAVFAAWSIGLSRRQAKANAEAIYRERRIDFDLDRLRELVESIEKGPNVSFSTMQAQTALRMLGREHALPLARTQYSVDTTDEDREQLAAWHASHPAHPAMSWETVQPALRDEAHAAVRAALARRPTDPAVSERLAQRVWWQPWTWRR